MLKCHYIASLLLIKTVFISVLHAQLSCVDEKNNSIDWFIALKYPKSYEFVYLTPNNTQWTPSANNLTSPNNMVALTLRQSYYPLNFYAYYNDEPANDNLYWDERGHLKGVLNFDKIGGYWLIHSIPKFPSAGTYIYKAGEAIYGQSLICVTVAVATLPSFVRQLLMMQPTVYSSNIPVNFSPDSALMADLTKLVTNTKVNTTKSAYISFETAHKVSLTHFGKSDHFDNDLYDALIAPSLRTSLFVESWIRGERVSSSCKTQFKVYNINKVSLSNQTFSESKDHSKWAVSAVVDQPFVCIGDINRMTSQFKRGGGSLCMSNAHVSKLFRAVVADYEKCS